MQTTARYRAGTGTAGSYRHGLRVGSVPARTRARSGRGFGR